MGGKCCSTCGKSFSMVWDSGENTAEEDSAVWHGGATLRVPCDCATNLTMTLEMSFSSLEF